MAIGGPCWLRPWEQPTGEGLEPEAVGPHPLNAACERPFVCVFLCVWGGRCADYILLNKTDLLQPNQLESLIEIVSSLNPLAKVTTLLSLKAVSRGVLQLILSVNIQLNRKRLVFLC
jgi:hypothetical protein